uniref:peptidylprolyl isomerase n=1 Tax=Brassica oleracea var. oleracea TaxID=109376 RepID=A0A0D3E2Z3_BRAOL
MIQGGDISANDGTEMSTALRKTKSQIFTNSALGFDFASLERRFIVLGALVDTEFAMRDEDNNVKALFRQGQAHMALNNIDAAAESLENALQFEPNDAGLKKEYAAVMKKIAIRDNEEKKQYRKMFG